MKNVTISIIVPVYKAEEYLCDCLNSILSQYYKDFELLLIDDGSPDKSGEICEEYAEKDDRIRVFHVENGGVGRARNIGIDNSIGRWIVFVDADDILLSSYLQMLMSYDSYDMIIGGHQEFGICTKDRFIDVEHVIDFNDVSSETLDFNKTYNASNILFYYPWGRMFKAEIIKKNGIKFNTKMRIAEDSCFIMEYYTFCNRLILIPCNNYLYRCINQPRKYMMDVEEYVYHKNTLAFYVRRMEHFCKCKLPVTFRYINEAFFMCFLRFLKNAEYHSYCVEVRKFRALKDKSIFGYIVKDENWMKALCYYIMIQCPFLGFGAIRLKQMMRK